MSPRWVKPLVAGLLVVVGVAAGLGIAELRREPHTAEPELMTGTVTWSNAETRMVAFEADDVRRDPLDGDAIYYLVGSAADLPACLSVTGEDQVRMDHRRVEVRAIHGTYGGPQQFHVAVQLTCLS